MKRLVVVVLFLLAGRAWGDTIARGVTCSPKIEGPLGFQEKQKLDEMVRAGVMFLSANSNTKWARTDVSAANPLPVSLSVGTISGTITANQGSAGTVAWPVRITVASGVVLDGSSATIGEVKLVAGETVALDGSAATIGEVKIVAGETIALDGGSATIGVLGAGAATIGNVGVVNYTDWSVSTAYNLAANGYAYSLSVAAASATDDLMVRFGVSTTALSVMWNCGNLGAVALGRDNYQLMVGPDTLELGPLSSSSHLYLSGTADVSIQVGRKRR